METLYRKVSVKERLPRGTGEYICFVTTGKVEENHYNASHNAVEFMLSRYSHWLEQLPHPSSEGEIDRLALEKYPEALINSHGEFGTITIDANREMRETWKLGYSFSRQHNRELIELLKRVEGVFPMHDGQMTITESEIHADITLAIQKHK